MCREHYIFTSSWYNRQLPHFVQLYGCTYYEVKIPVVTLDRLSLRLGFALNLVGLLLDYVHHAHLELRSDLVRVNIISFTRPLVGPQAAPDPQGLVKDT